MSAITVDHRYGSHTAFHSALPRDDLRLRRCRSRSGASQPEQHHFPEEYFFRPSAIVCYSAGQFGGVRAAMHLRATLAELGMPSIASLLPVPRVQDAFTPSGDP